MRYVAVSLPFSSFSSFMFIIVSLPFSSFNCSSCYHFRVKRNRFFHLCIFEREIINENILTTADELKGSFFVINDRTGSRGVGGWIPAVFFSLAQTPRPPRGRSPALPLWLFYFKLFSRSKNACSIWVQWHQFSGLGRDLAAWFVGQSAMIQHMAARPNPGDVKPENLLFAENNVGRWATSSAGGSAMRFHSLGQLFVQRKIPRSG